MRFAAVLLAVVMLLMDPVRLLLSALLLTTLDTCLQISNISLKFITCKAGA